MSQFLIVVSLANSQDQYEFHTTSTHILNAPSNQPSVYLGGLQTVVHPQLHPQTSRT